MARIAASNRAFSLLEIVMALAIAMISVLIFMKFYITNSKQDKFAVLMSEYEEARRKVRKEMDCDQTFTPIPPNCASNGNIDVRRSDNSILISAVVNDSGNWLKTIHLQARCINSPDVDPDAKRLQILARKETAQGSDVAAANPVTGTVLTWIPLFNVPVCKPVIIP